MATPPLRVLIAGGGTGGHLYPGIAVARAFLARDTGSTVTFVGTASGIESRVVPREGFVLDEIRSAGLKGKSVRALIKGVAMLPVSAFDAWRVLSRRRPDVVIGVGGYSSGPVVLLAAMRRIPSMLLEQNAVPGLTNRLLSKVVGAAAVTYEETLAYFGRVGFVSGNPVRPEFFTGRATELPEPEPRPAVVLIFGGSQGAHAINVAMVEAATDLQVRGPLVMLVHQTGERDVDVVRDGYRRAGVEARVEPFIYGMDEEMKRADLVVSRAGATTLAELAAAGKPAVLIPFPQATDNHQVRNAEVLARAGAAEMIEQRDLTGLALAERIRALLTDRGRLDAMAAAIARYARPDAAERIVGRAVSLAGAGG